MGRSPCRAGRASCCAVLSTWDQGGLFSFVNSKPTTVTPGDRGESTPEAGKARQRPARQASPQPANKEAAAAPRPSPRRRRPPGPRRTPCRRAWLLRARTQARCHCSRRDRRASSAASSARAPASSAAAPRRRGARRAADRQYWSSQAATVSSEAAKSSTSAAQPGSGPMATQGGPAGGPRPGRCHLLPGGACAQPPHRPARTTSFRRWDAPWRAPPPPPPLPPAPPGSPAMEHPWAFSVLDLLGS